MSCNNKLQAKLLLKAKLTAQTGLHIGGLDAYSAIGAIDSHVVKDPISNLPIIPGSSIKGKLRSLLAAAFNKTPGLNPNEDHERIRRLFGDSISYKNARLIFRDMRLSNAEELLNRGAESLTEVKSENTIKRNTATAMPRHIERAIAGSAFNFELIYDLVEEEEIIDDFQLLAEGLRLLEYDYLGGHGSRGYGRISFSGFEVEVVFGDLDVKLLDQLLAVFSQFDK